MFLAVDERAESMTFFTLGSHASLSTYPCLPKKNVFMLKNYDTTKQCAWKIDF